MRWWSSQTAKPLAGFLRKLPRPGMEGDSHLTSARSRTGRAAAVSDVISATWTSPATMCRSCSTLSWLFTPPRDARRSVPSACGHRHISGHAVAQSARLTTIAAEMGGKAKRYWPEVKEFFFDDDTFSIQKARTVELAEAQADWDLTWSCTSRVTTDFETRGR